MNMKPLVSFDWGLTYRKTTKRIGKVIILTWGEILSRLGCNPTNNTVYFNAIF